MMEEREEIPEPAIRRENTQMVLEQRPHLAGSCRPIGTEEAHACGYT